MTTNLAGDGGKDHAWTVRGCKVTKQACFLTVMFYVILDEAVVVASNQPSN
jgi:hypothetical protein